MIHEFCVKNVLSFKDKQFFSFEANVADEHYAEHYFIPTEDPNIKLLKMAMFYGANASGKLTF
jgi:AAA15 family ATPase/GTPase